jgi:hypothetical protein
MSELLVLFLKTIQTIKLSLKKTKGVQIPLFHLFSRFVFTVVNNQPNYLKIFFLNDFSLQYIGNFVEGKPHGRGKLIWKSGDSCDGKIDKNTCIGAKTSESGTSDERGLMFQLPTLT